jgi:hypothetical protein
MKITHNAKARQINFLDERFYTMDNESYFPSVTTILKVWPKFYGYETWLKDLGHNADIKLKEAGKQGTNVHNGCEALLKGGILEWADENGRAKYTLDEWLMMMRFAEFWNTYQPELIACETNLASADLQFGGTIDLVVKLDGKIWIIDIKSSNNLHETYDMQMAAYAMLWNERHPDQQIEELGILWLKSSTRGPDKKGLVKQGKNWILKQPTKGFEELCKMFSTAQWIWQIENPKYEPKNVTYADYIKLDRKAV